MFMVERGAYITLSVLAQVYSQSPCGRQTSVSS